MKEKEEAEHRVHWRDSIVYTFNYNITKLVKFPLDQLINSPVTSMGQQLKTICGLIMTIMS